MRFFFRIMFILENQLVVKTSDLILDAKNWSFFLPGQTTALLHIAAK